MGFEEEGSKSGGGYSGGFFQLFDWTAKSRKKLFSSKTDLPERTTLGRKGDGNFPLARINLIDHDEIGARSRVKGSSDYSCASSVTDDEGCGTKAPGVVARLMGLDSLPSSNLSEYYSGPLFESQPFRDVRYHRRNCDYHQDNQITYAENFLHKSDVPARNPVELKPPPKIVSRPIEKFQTETLPPKLAKSIPITHHKLLSPIKNPGFITSKNAAHIMEAAAKIIEPPVHPSIKAKMPLAGSSSVPLKARAPKEKMELPQRLTRVGSSSLTLKAKDLKEKVEDTDRSSRLADASRRPLESNASRHLKGQSLNKSWNGSPDASFMASSDAGDDTSGSKDKGKSISLAIQAKVNVQRREGLSSSCNRSLTCQKEDVEVRSSQPFKSQNIQNNIHKKSSAHNASGHIASDVLRQNNQKQNFLVDRQKLPSKPSVPGFDRRKQQIRDLSPGNQNISGRAIGSSRRKFGLEVADGEKEDSYSSAKDFPRKKRSIDRDFHFDKKQVVDKVFNDRNQLPIHSTTQLSNLKNQVNSSTVIEKPYSWADESKKKGTDVVSFTFTAPLTRPVPGSEFSDQVAQRKSGLCTDDRDKRVLLDKDSMKFSSMGYNVIGADSLSVFLEQKLQELTDGVEFSCRDSIKAGSGSTSASLLPDLSPSLVAANSMPSLGDNRNQRVVISDKPLGLYGSESSFSDSPMFRVRQRFQGIAEADECRGSSKGLGSGQVLGARHPSPVSILEPSFSCESCDSSVSIDSNSTEGSKLCSSVQAQEVASLTSSKLQSTESEMELSDSASSMSSAVLVRKQTSMSDLVASIEWELEYVREIIFHVESTFNDFTIYHSSHIVNPHLFNQLESRRGGFSTDSDQTRLRRKVMFDCVSECTDMRFRQFVVGGYRKWEKGVGMLRRNDQLAKEIYKEISCWNSMGDCMVDELVDKDMSSKYGRWLEFEVDAFALGVEFEGQILNSLVDEVLRDILLF